jgi:hypothetical protein
MPDKTKKHPPHTTDLFFIDDDIVFPPEKVIEFLLSDAPIKEYSPELDSYLSWEEAIKELKRRKDEKEITENNKLE